MGIEDWTFYFHAPYCDVRSTVLIPLPEGRLYLATKNANCCRKVKKEWNELPKRVQGYFKEMEAL